MYACATVGAFYGLWWLGKKVSNYFAGRKSYKGKTVVITGASSGIGEQLAYAYAKDGANIVLAARREDKLKTVAQKVKELGGKALIVKTDVTDFEQSKNLIDASVQEFGGIDLLIPNAGCGAFGCADSYVEGEKVINKLMDVNLKGAMYVTVHAMKHIRASNGTIAPVLSMAGLMAQPLSSVYCSTKFGMKGFFESVRMEGVNVTLICPGVLTTEFLDALQMSDNTSMVFPDAVLDTAKSMAYNLEAAVSEYKQSIARGDDMYNEGTVNWITLTLYKFFPNFVGSMFIANFTKGLTDKKWQKFIPPKPATAAQKKKN
mmetsp:Transcript_2705/g.3044  ORF Transcript_2705/g.3044 Transcript_2705/m.3044 type:complete len:317 (-) Transcript_2705:107-1057(-)